MTRLSICIPTRNRQAFAIDAARHMLAKRRDDFEVVIADNSDDAGPLAAFAAETADTRLRLIAPEAAPLSMRDNWERMIPQTRGDWVTIIGDDDYLDPDLAEVIRVAAKAVPKVDSLSWGRSYYTWPDARAPREITRMPTRSHLRTLEKKELMRRTFFWEDASDRPTCPFGVYHGAVRRDLLERTREAFSGRYFEHPNCDYDSICKTVMLAEAFVLFERPLSVFGTCRASNSMGLRDEKIGEERVKTLLAESPEGFEAAGFPFPPSLGITASVAHTIESFKQKYGIELTGWEENFIRACARDCETAADRGLYDRRKAGYSRAIEAWRGPAAKKLFRPEYKYLPNVPRFLGHADDTLYFDMDMGETRSAGEFYAMIDAMLFPVHLLEGRLA